jgi:hypothetical protein
VQSFFLKKNFLTGDFCIFFAGKNVVRETFAGREVGWPRGGKCILPETAYPVICIGSAGTRMGHGKNPPGDCWCNLPGYCSLLRFRKVYTQSGPDVNLFSRNVIKKPLS